MNELASLASSQAFLNPSAGCRGRKFIFINSEQNEDGDRETVDFQKWRRKLLVIAEFEAFSFTAEKLTLIFFLAWMVLAEHDEYFSGELINENWLGSSFCQESVLYHQTFW